MVSNIWEPTVCQSSSGDSKEKKEKQTSPAAPWLVELEKECLCLLYLLCKGSRKAQRKGVCLGRCSREGLFEPSLERWVEINQTCLWKGNPVETSGHLQRWGGGGRARRYHWKGCSLNLRVRFLYIRITQLTCWKCRFLGPIPPSCLR